jgi:hypothetical protein
LYLKYSEEDRLNEYLRAVDNLTIDTSNRLQAQVDEYKHQQLEIDELKRQLGTQCALLAVPYLQYGVVHGSNNVYSSTP